MLDYRKQDLAGRALLLLLLFPIGLNLLLLLLLLLLLPRQVLDLKLESLLLLLEVPEAVLALLMLFEQGCNQVLHHFLTHSEFFEPVLPQAAQLGVLFSISFTTRS